MTELGKRAAAHAAAALVTDGMILGLGTGSTVNYLLDELARLDVPIRGIPTSEATERRARELGFTVLRTGDVEHLDLAIDGADELTSRLDLTKGGGGALLREKVVASMAQRFLVIATLDKCVERLGETFPLPIEVVPFALPVVSRRIEQLGFAVTPRDDGAYRTDNGNAVVDASIEGGIQNPADLEQHLRAIPGVVCTGLFVGMADEAILGCEDGSIQSMSSSSNAASESST